MKTFIVPALVSLSFAAPAFADTTSLQKFFALTNDSPAENIVRETSTGNVVGARQTFALTNDSPAENTARTFRARNVDVKAIQRMFALTNDSPAENIVR